MKQIHKTAPLPENPCIRHYFSESCTFFDIETTGFSPKNAFVYLIGMSYRKAESIHIFLFLAENRTEEAGILNAFFEKTASFHTILTFNGLTFDVPFLKARAKLHRIPFDLDSHKLVDLYKLTGKLAHLFHLPDKKQKTVEHFLGIDRKDAFSGGELIPVYFAYEKQRDFKSESLLLLHNYEDVLGMTELLPLLSYADFLETPAEVLSALITDCGSYDPIQNKRALLLTLSPPLPFPKQILYQTNLCSLKCSGDSAKLLIYIFDGELRFFYENYKDYYYLPEEDTAIHKSVAAFVDSGHRKKASKSNCYTRKSGAFLPQPLPVRTPSFYQEKQSGLSYFEMTKDFLSDTAALNTYASHLLEVLKKAPKKLP